MLAPAGTAAVFPLPELYNTRLDEEAGVVRQEFEVLEESR
jgi:hypothetical protein